MVSRRKDAEGQAMVETAIIAPLFVFVVLGILQMTLVQEAQVMLKYAAYRAARAGAMNNACGPKMERAALATLIPEIGLNDKLLSADGADKFLVSWELARWNRYATLPPLQIVNVRICGPLKAWVEGADSNRLGNNQEMDFDDPRNVYVSQAPTSPGALSQGANLRGFERTKLKIQIRFNYRLLIPYANAIIFRTWMGQKVSETIRYNDKGSGWFSGSSPKIAADVGQRFARESTIPLRAQAAQGNYFLPLYANYSMRMQSNFFLKACPLPTDNQCRHYNDGSSQGAP